MKRPFEEPLRYWCNAGHKLKAHFGCLLPQSIFRTVPSLFVALVENGFVVRRFGPKHVVDDTGHFVCCGCRGLRSSEFGAHAAKELSKVIFCATERVGSEPESQSGAAMEKES